MQTSSKYTQEHIQNTACTIPLAQQSDIAILLPAYNESMTVQNTVLSFHKALPAARIYVIDNNSSDNTKILAQQIMKEHAIPGAVLTEKRQGKGNAIRRAFLDIEAKVYLLADADCTYPAEQAAELVLPILMNEADMVVGDRHSSGAYARENTRPLHNFGNNLVQKLVNFVGGTHFIDVMTGYRALSYTFVRSYPLLVEGFQIETDLTLFAAQGRFRCIEIPIKYVDRPAGSFSKLHTVRDGISVLLTIFRILRFYKPLLFFLSMTCFFGLLGIIIGIPVVWEYIEYHYVYKVPTAILAVGLEIFATVLFSVGLTLDAIAHQRHIELEKSIMHHTHPQYKKL